MLNQNQQILAKAIANFVGETLHLVPNQTDVQQYTALIVAEVQAVAGAPASTNPIKDETEAVLNLGDAILLNLPDDAKGKGKLKGALTVMKGMAHMFGL